MEGSQPPVSGGSGARDERAEEYFTWKGARAAVDFRGYIRNVRGVLKLSHSGILKDAGIAESLARSNPLIKQDLERMEEDLRELGLIPSRDTSEEPPAQAAGDDKPNKPIRSARDKRRIEELEQDLARVRLERDDAREALKRYGMLEEYMSETMRLPR